MDSTARARRSVWPVVALTALVALTAFQVACAVRGTGALHGVVTDTAASPLPEMLVVMDTGERARTSDDGRFVIPAVRAGRHRVVVLNDHCRGAAIEVDVAADDSTRVEIAARLTPLDSIVPESGTPTGSEGRVITDNDIAEMENVRDVVDILRRVEPYMVGPPTSQTGAAPRLRSRGGGRTPGDARAPIIVIDGLVLHTRDSAVLESIPAQDVAWIEIVPGAIGGWQYGTEGSGGLLRIRTQTGNFTIESGNAADCISFQ